MASVLRHKCNSCQQAFDSRQPLFRHLQQNPAHKRGKSKSKSDVSKRRSQVGVLGHVEPNDHAAAISESSAAQTSTAKTQQHSGSTLLWSCVTTEQDLRLRDILPVKCHSPETLQACQYHLKNRTRHQLEQLQTCINCKRQRRLTSPDQPCVFHPDHRVAKGKRKARPRTCCTSQSRGCQTASAHVYPPVVYDDFTTSPRELALPANTLHTSQRLAVVMDCEMVAVTGGSSELAQLCVVDLITAEVLLNRLVQPNGKVIDWRTKYSGITLSSMTRAVCDGQALQGWQAARAELRKFVNSDTVLVGHALQHDLKSLHLIHHRIVDTSIMTRLAVHPDCKRSWSLKVLCAELAGRVVQNHGSKGHDCLEDTLATREVFLRCVLQPEVLETWSTMKRIEQQVKDLERDLAKSLRIQKTSRPATDRMISKEEEEYDFEFDEERSSTSERLHWSDIAEDLGWPHPDTGYDPWSD